MATISAAYLRFLTLLRMLAGVVIFTIFVLIVLDVFLTITQPILGIIPSAYTHGLVEFGLLWFTMLAAPSLVRNKGHVYIDAFVQLLRPSHRRAVEKLAYVFCVAGAAVFFYYALDLFLYALETGDIDPRGEDFPVWIGILPMPLCFFLVTIEFGRYLLGFDTFYGDRTDMREGA